MRISDWSSDVCSSDLAPLGRPPQQPRAAEDVEGSQGDDEDGPAGAHACGSCSSSTSCSASSKSRRLRGCQAQAHRATNSSTRNRVTIPKNLSVPSGFVLTISRTEWQEIVSQEGSN